MSFLLLFVSAAPVESVDSTPTMIRWTQRYNKSSSSSKQTASVKQWVGVVVGVGVVGFICVHFVAMVATIVFLLAVASVVVVVVAAAVFVARLPARLLEAASAFAVNVASAAASTIRSEMNDVGSSSFLFLHNDLWSETERRLSGELDVT